ncbi:substrate-binding domain-containing protein [Amylibacter sp.]|nr:substrate-binding domain-containing protein [Amylibacter sp.]
MKFIFLLILFFANSVNAEKQEIILSSTTSTQNSGLYDYILPMFTQDTGILVKVVAVGTGQAIRIARNGDADALLVHHRPSEDLFMKENFGTYRYDIMYNDFVLIGPKNTNATFKNLADFFIEAGKFGTFRFISRGDDSGTHKKEIELWNAFTYRNPSGEWYIEIGSGMGAALNMASATNSYTLSDRGTWLSFKNKGDLEIKWAGDLIMQNPYGLILVNPDVFPHIKSTQAKIFANWLTSSKGQKAIGDFKVDGKQLFCPNADKTNTKSLLACPAN